MTWLLTSALLAAFFAWVITLHYQREIQSERDERDELKIEHQEVLARQQENFTVELTKVMMEWASNVDELEKKIEILEAR